MTTEVLAARGIGMSFGPVSVLRDVDLDVRAGEAHALVGENGAGKSTLGKILAGQLRPSAGTLLIDGQPARLAGIREAQARGIVLIHQELNLAGHLSVAANIFLGREPTRSGLLDQRAMDAGARDALAELGCVLDPSRTVSTLTVAQRQMVEIAKAATRTLRVLVMDEPTAVLTGAESDHLMTFIRRLQARGTAIVYVSHKLDEVLALADRVTVLRDGDRVATRPARDLSEHEVARLMVGRDVVDVFPPRAPPPADAPEVLTVSDVRVPGHVHGASFGVRRGEILGFAGLVGAGRTELMEGVMGLRAGSGGTVARDGRPVRIRTPRDAMRAGIAYLTEDRKGRGLLVRQPARPNLTLADLARYGRVFTDPSRETAALAAATAAFDIRAGDRAAAVSTYSGGNQQKLLLAKTMQTQPRVLIVDEPTRGIDIGTKQQIYRFLHALAAGGVAVIVVSSDMAEVIGMSHRVAVMRAGWIAGVLEGDAITETAIVGLATGTAEARDAAA